MLVDSSNLNSNVEDTCKSVIGNIILKIEDNSKENSSVLKKKKSVNFCHVDCNK